MTLQSDNLFLPVFKEALPPANRIPRDDYRYDLLQTIPEKEYEAREDMNYVYLRINDEKDYFITVHIRPKSETDYDEYHGNTHYESTDDDDDDDSTTNVESDHDDNNETHKENHDTDYWDDNGYPNFTDILHSSLLGNPHLMHLYGYYVKPYTFLANENTEKQGNVDDDQDQDQEKKQKEEIEDQAEEPDEEPHEEEEEEDEETVVETQVQTFRYTGNRVMWLSGAKVYIK
jgi:hypothetical protein